MRLLVCCKKNTDFSESISSAAVSSCSIYFFISASRRRSRGARSPEPQQPGGELIALDMGVLPPYCPEDQKWAYCPENGVIAPGGFVDFFMGQ